jgi:hypothetical protein
MTSKIRNHVLWEEAGADPGQRGDKGKKLVEPIPVYAKRPGDKIITGEQNNNAWIVVGRDRPAHRGHDISPRAPGESYKPLGDGEYENLHSGYGNCMGAGAIDIVVGRMAPYAFNEFPSESTPGEKQISVGPLFNTKLDDKKLQTLELSAGEMGSKSASPRPGFSMDAARIYISQKTDADLNFDIFNKFAGDAGVPAENMRSAIVSKADQIRLFAREDIKIVTAAASVHGKERFNSQGGTLDKVRGIHLIAGNGVDNAGDPIPPEPMVCGNRLVKALDNLVEQLSAHIGVVNKFIQDQMVYNNAVQAHTHIAAAPGFPVTPSPALQFFGPITSIRQGAHSFVGCAFNKVNLAGWKIDHTSGKKTDGEDLYILSRYNTVN